MAKVDLIVRSDSAYVREAFPPRRRLPIGPLEARVASPEDLILSKLVGARETVFQAHLRDVRCARRGRA